MRLQVPFKYRKTSLLIYNGLVNHISHKGSVIYPLGGFYPMSITKSNHFIYSAKCFGQVTDRGKWKEPGPQD